MATRVLVAGAGGFIGHHMVKYLVPPMGQMAEMGLDLAKAVSFDILEPWNFLQIKTGAKSLAGAGNQHGAHILISEFPLKAVKATYRTRPVDFVIVKGKTEPVGVYEVLDYHDDESYPNLVDALGIFNDGHRCWNEGKWDQSTKLFKDVLKINPDDKAAKLYIDRCAHMKKNPPKGDWDGVWIMKTK